MWRARLANLRFEWRGLRQRPLPADTRRVLIYHGVTDRGDQLFNSRFVSTARLAADLALLAAVPGLRFVRLEDLFAVDGPPGPRIAVTFDDGYRNFLTHALPVLAAANVPATLYITALHAAGQLDHAAGFATAHDNGPVLWADHLDIAAQVSPGPMEIAGEHFIQDRQGQWRLAGNGTPLKKLCKTRAPAFLSAVLAGLRQRCAALPESCADYWSLLNPDQIATVADHPLVTIGAHGVSHCSFPTLTTAQAWQELVLGRDWLSNVIGRQVVDFAWPDGDYTSELANMAEQAGYLLQGLTDYASAADADDPRLVNRLGVNPFISARAQHAVIAAGGYGHEVYGT